MKVCKFGGSSLANAAQLNKVIDIVLADPSRRIVVVSAPGKRHSGDTKVTDLLIALADTALKGENTDRQFGAVVERYASIADELKLGDDIVRQIEADLKDRLAKVSSLASWRSRTSGFVHSPRPIIVPTFMLRTPRDAMRFTDSRMLFTLSRQTTIDTVVGKPRS